MSKNDKEENSDESSFKVKPVNDWIKEGLNLPESRPLFGSIWHEHELAILFGNTGKGKSINSYQIFDAITKGVTVLGLETTKLRALYLDFELSKRSLANRYSNIEKVHYSFNENFLRAEINFDAIDFEGDSIKNGILSQIESYIVKHKASVICIDNISYISSNNEKGSDASKLIKGLLKISKSLNVAILIIAHRPKIQIPNSPVTLDHLAGSKNLSNFCDQVFSICDSVKSSDTIYIKELKNRNRKMIYDEHNVIECRIVKDDNFLKFEKIGMGKESEHLHKVKDKTINRLDEVLSMKNEGLSNVYIAKKLKVSEGTIRNILKGNN
jgi:RecA-family ATPase